MNPPFRFSEMPGPPFSGGPEDPLVMYNPHTGWMAWKPPSGQMPHPAQFGFPPQSGFQPPPFPTPGGFPYPSQFGGFQTPVVPAFKRGAADSELEEGEIVHIGDVTPTPQPSRSFAGQKRAKTQQDDSECMMCKDLGVSSRFSNEMDMRVHAEKHARQLSVTFEQCFQSCFPSLLSNSAEISRVEEPRSFIPPSPQHLPEIKTLDSDEMETPRKFKTKKKESNSGDKTSASNYKTKFTKNTPARCFSTLTPTLNDLVKNLIATARDRAKGTIVCLFGPSCNFSITEGLSNLKATLKSTCHHLIQHFPEKLYYCEICGMEVRSSEHIRSHPKQKMRVVMLDCFDEKESELIELFHRCFTPKTNSSKSKQLALVTSISESGTEVARKPARKLNRTPSVQCPIKPNTPFDMSQGIRGRTTTAAIPPEIYKVSQWMIKTMHKTGEEIQCQYSEDCHGIWKPEKKLERDSHTTTMSMFTHVLRHLNEPLFYCSKCDTWEIKPENHRTRLHKGELPPTFMLDFVDFRKKELALIFVACFPNQSHALDAALKSLDLPRSVIKRGKKREIPKKTDQEKPNLKKELVLKKEVPNGEPMQPGYLTQKIMLMSEAIKHEFRTGMLINCQLCSYHFPFRQGMTMAHARKYLRRSLTNHVLRHVDVDLYHCTICDKSIRYGDSHTGKVHPKMEAKNVMIVVNLDEHKEELNDKFKQCFLTG